MTTTFLTGRVRLARNLANVPFPSRMSADEARSVIDKVWEAISASSLAPTLKLIKSEECDSVHLTALSEHHLISPDFLRGKLPRAVILSEDNKISIMITRRITYVFRCLPTTTIFPKRMKPPTKSTLFSQRSST
jgi:protein arginine kinase